MSEMVSRLCPVVVVLGATGTGKSKLAIQLAQQFSGEIISADSMQVYRGLDIITAKVTSEERALVRHHMMDLLDPHQEFTVHDFRNQSLPIIKDIQARGQLPIVVGGTNYYIESLLWQVLVDTSLNTQDEVAPPLKRALVVEPTCSQSPENQHKINNEDTQSRDNTSSTLQGLQANAGHPECLNRLVGDSTGSAVNSGTPQARDELHKRLQAIDPAYAAGLHPNNRRKIQRALEVASSGKKLSELLEEQRRLPGGGDLGGPLRFPDAILLWLTAEMEVLDLRLDARVDGMVSAGLIDELVNFHTSYNHYRLTHNKEADYTRGVFQSIGFKEFHEYLILDEAARSTAQGLTLLEKGIEQLKLVTRRYARRQNKWINNRFLRKPHRQVPPIYSLDCTDLSQWDSKVRDIAVDIVRARLSGLTPSHAALPPRPPPTHAADHVPNTCHVCNRLFIGSLQWAIHLKSFKHRKMLSKQNKYQ